MHVLLMLTAVRPALAHACQAARPSCTPVPSQTAKEGFWLCAWGTPSPLLLGEQHRTAIGTHAEPGEGDKRRSLGEQKNQRTSVVALT